MIVTRNQLKDKDGNFTMSAIETVDDAEAVLRDCFEHISGLETKLENAEMVSTTLALGNGELRSDNEKLREKLSELNAQKDNALKFLNDEEEKVLKEINSEPQVKCPSCHWSGMYAECAFSTFTFNTSNFPHYRCKKCGCPTLLTKTVSVCELAVGSCFMYYGEMAHYCVLEKPEPNIVKCRRIPDGDVMRQHGLSPVMPVTDPKILQEILRICVQAIQKHE